MEKNEPPSESEMFSNLQRKHMKTYTYLKTRKKSLPDEKKLNHYLTIWAENTISFVLEKNVKK